MFKSVKLLVLLQASWIVATVEGCKRDKPRPPVSPYCTPGEWFPAPDGCNNCYCPENGVREDASCTELGCRRKRSVDSACTPGDTWTDVDGCNSCFCSETGIALCTRKACVQVMCQEYEGGDFHPIGSSWKSADGCNNCFCSETGIAACTQMVCVP